MVALDVARGRRLALVAGGVLLALNPTVSYHPPYVAPSGIHSAFAIPPNFRVRFLCISPFSQLTGVQQQFSGPAGPSAFTGQLAVAPGNPQPKAVSAACGAAANGQEHIAEALGGGAVLLLGLSFLPLRREPATRAAARTFAGVVALGATLSCQREWRAPDAAGSTSRVGAEQGAANEAVKRHNLGPCQASHYLRLPSGRYDLKLWIAHPIEGAAYLPS